MSDARSSLECRFATSLADAPKADTFREDTDSGIGSSRGTDVEIGIDSGVDGFCFSSLANTADLRPLLCRSDPLADDSK